MVATMIEVFKFMRKHSFRKARWEHGELDCFYEAWPVIGESFSYSEFTEPTFSEWYKLQELLRNQLGRKSARWFHV